MNDHLLKFPYKSRPPSVFSSFKERLANLLYSIHCRLQPPVSQESSSKSIRVACVSDTHNSTPIIPNADLLVHAGDLTERGTYEELQAQISWLSSLPHKYKVVIAGNHDLQLDSTFVDRFPSRVGNTPIRQLDWGNVIYLQDSSISLTFENGRTLNIYGSPMTPQCGLWAFQYPEIRDVWTRKIPDNTDIVVVHGPPALHCDLKKGDGYFLRELRRVKPCLAVVGHIHDGYGKDILLEDGVQEIWEDVILQGRGLLTIFRIAISMPIAWLGAWLCISKPKWTTLVNAAITPVHEKVPLVVDM